MAKSKRDSDSVFKLTREALFGLASARIVRRGIAYANGGHVLDLAVSPNRLEARVAGTEREPYIVSLEHDGEEILPECSCPFDWEPFCKHAVAALALHSDLAGPEIKKIDTEKRELEVRKKRAEKGAFKIIRRDGVGFFGLFDVVSSSGKTYAVEIRSLGERVNRCSCPDHETSMLGTCKHIEAVLLSLEKRARRKFAKAKDAPPDIAQILVDRVGETPRLRLMLPVSPSRAVAALAAELFDADGYFTGDLVRDFPRIESAGRRSRKLIVYEDAYALSRREADTQRAKERKRKIRNEVVRLGARIPGIKTTLYPYQLEGAAFLASAGRGLLGDDMGLGKTVQAIAATHLLRRRNETRRALVVCPASLKHQWAKEIKRFTGLESQIIGGTVPERLAQFRQQAPFTIVNYELIMRDRRGIDYLEPDLLILDEAQRIKNWRTKTAYAIKDIDTPYAFVLTGTPLQNRLDDLYSIMQVVDKQILGPLWAYNERFIVREEGKSRIKGYKNLADLRQLLSPHVLRRSKEDVDIQLPERVDNIISVEMTSLQRELMEDAVSNAARLAKIAERRPLTPEEEKRLLAAMQCARMACNAAGLVDKETVGSPKLDEFEQVIQELCVDQSRKVVVFSEWERFGRMAAERADRHGIGYVRLHGGVPTAKRGALIDKFRDDPDCKVFFSTDAGGVGLNLQFASTVVNLDIPWNPAVFDQRIGRVYRHGQKSSVHVVVIVSEKSFESGLINTLGTKRSLFAAALDQSSEATEVNAPTSCLGAVRTALEQLQAQQPEAEPASVEGESGEDAPVEAALPETTEVADEEAVATEILRPLMEKMKPKEKIVDLLGSRLRRIVALPSGRLVALVDKLDEVTREAASKADIGVAEIGMLDAMAGLGTDSPFDNAETVYEQTVEETAGADLHRKEQLAVATRKLEAAKTLAGSGLGAESIALSCGAMHAALRALAGGEETQGQLPPARLLYEKLVPEEKLTLEQAAVISRADSLALAYANSAQPVDEALVSQILDDARALMASLI